MSSIFETLAETATASQYAAKLAELKAWLSTATDLDIDVNDPVLTSVLLGPLTKYVVDQQLLVDSLETYSRLSRNVVNAIADPDQQIALQQFLAQSLGVENSPAGFAIGEIEIRVTSDKAITVPRGTLFSAGALTFQTQSVAFFRAADQQLGETGERPLLKQADGTWSGTLSVVAVQPGSASNVVFGTTFTSNFAITSLSRLSASTTFVGGRDANTLQDLIDAVFNNTAFRTFGSRDQITAFIQTREDIGNVRQVGVVGYGDPELKRDKHTFLPLQAGGKADLYLASEFYPTQHTVIVDAVVKSKTVQSPTVTETTYTLGIGRDVSPGYLKIVQVTDTANGEVLDVVGEVRGFDVSPTMGMQHPHLENPFDAGFSRYQTATVTLTAKQSAAYEPGDTRSLQVTFLRVPGIDTAQAVASSRQLRYVGGDVLVRTAIPILLKVRIYLISAFDTAIPLAEDIKNAVANEVMRRPMRPVLYRSDISQAIGRFLPDDLALDSIEFEGELIHPSGKIERLVQSDRFVTPIRLTEGFSPRTIALYTTASEVNVSASQLVTITNP